MVETRPVGFGLLVWVVLGLLVLFSTIRLFFPPLFLISRLVSGSRVSLTQGRAGPAGVETAGREHGSCNHAVGE